MHRGASLTLRGILGSESVLSAVGSADAREPARQRPMGLWLQVQPVLPYGIKGWKPATNRRTTAEIHTGAAGGEGKETDNNHASQSTRIPW